MRKELEIILGSEIRPFLMQKNFEHLNLDESGISGGFE